MLASLRNGAKFNMALNEPRPKKNCKLSPSLPLPLRTSGRRFKGSFNGFSVVVENDDDMKDLISMGYFGKATLSRNHPQFQSEIIWKRVFNNRKRYFCNENKPQKVILLPDNDNESNEEYFTNLKPEFQLDYSGIKENVNLSLHEAFFLASAVNCIDIVDEKPLGLDELWNLFKETDPHFVQNYIAYYYFRSKNWVVKEGIKFGGDFLLYKQGPPFYHASYLVIIHIIDEDLKPMKDQNRRSLKKTRLMGLSRLCETAAKDLLICEIIWPNNLTCITFGDISKFSVKETVMKRWTTAHKEDT